MPLTVEIWSDVVCPWCYIGKRRFEAALAAFEHARRGDGHVALFELDPEAPKVAEGTATERLAAKYGMSLERAQQLHAEMTERAAEEGLDFRFDLARGGNTFDAHRLIHLAATYGHQAAAKERLMRAYFTEGEPIADPETLIRARRRGGRRSPTRRATSCRPTASPKTCARTSCWPRSSASRACRSSCSTAATACPARSRPRCCVQALERAWGEAVSLSA